MDGVSPSISGIDPDAILPPAQLTVLVNDYFIISPLFPAEVPYLHLLQPLPRAFGHLDILPLTMIKPIKEILIRRTGFPLRMILPQVTAISMFLVNHFQEIGEIHRLGGFGPFLFLGEAFPLPSFFLGCGGGVIVGRRGERRFLVCSCSAGNRTNTRPVPAGFGRGPLHTILGRRGRGSMRSCKVPVLGLFNCLAKTSAGSVRHAGTC